MANHRSSFCLGYFWSDILAELLMAPPFTFKVSNSGWYIKWLKRNTKLKHIIKSIIYQANMDKPNLLVKEIDWEIGGLGEIGAENGIWDKVRVKR